MYKDRSVLCVIPARGGSRGLPGKNIRPLLGKPLIAWSIEHARQSRYIDRVIVSTEDDAIAKIASQFGAELPFERPRELAADASSTIDVLLHALDWLKEHQGFSPDILVLLHATAPLRTAADIDRCIEMLVDTNAPNVFSVTASHRNPYFNMVERDNRGNIMLAKHGRFLTRQSAPEVFDMNASIYVWWTRTLQREKKTILEGSQVYVMPKERSVDIDDALDFSIAEHLMRQQGPDGGPDAR